MTTNPLMDWTSEEEQALMQDLLGDAIQNFGMNMVWLPRQSNSTFDILYGDDPTKTYNENFTIECYIQSVDEFEGSEMFSKFGLHVKKQVRLLMPNEAFKRETDGTTYTRPQEGDLIWTSNFKALFEIKYVDEEYFFYNLGRNGNGPGFYGFSLICEKFHYNNEDITSGIEDLDETVRNIIATYAMTLSVGGTGSYIEGEQVYQTSNNAIHGEVTSSAIVNNFDVTVPVLNLHGIQGKFLASQFVFGTQSHAVWIVSNINLLDDVNAGLQDNELIENESDDVLDFSEDNPFGEPD